MKVKQFRNNKLLDYILKFKKVESRALFVTNMTEELKHLRSKARAIIPLNSINVQ